jgi:hypothetical protein
MEEVSLHPQNFPKISSVFYRVAAFKLLFMPEFCVNANDR